MEDLGRKLRRATQPCMTCPQPRREDPSTQHGRSVLGPQSPTGRGEFQLLHQHLEVETRFPHL